MRQHTIYPDCDIKFTGHVTWVGKTSIEAKMHMSQVDTKHTHARSRTHIHTQTVSNSLNSSLSSTMAPTLQSWMPRLSWWREIQRTRGRTIAFTLKSFPASISQDFLEGWEKLKKRIHPHLFLLLPSLLLQGCLRQPPPA